MPVRVEVCVETPAGTLTSERAGADRVELCQALILGGLTPSLGCVATAAAQAASIGIHVLIRPREGDFVFTPLEVDVMLADITAIKRETAGAGVEVGFVIGALTPSSTVDRTVTAALIAAADGAPVSFHRAFDLTADLGRSLDALIDLGVGRVLTSGGAPRAAEATGTLAALVRQADGRIDVMPGGSIRAHNVGRILGETGARDVHFRATAPQPNVRSPRRAHVRMSAGSAPDETYRDETSIEAVRQMVALVSEPPVSVRP